VASEWEPLVDELKRQGFVIERTEGNHWRCKPPGGKGGMTHFSQSGDHAAFRNTVTHLRKMGFVWPPAEPRSKRNGAGGVSSKADVCCTLCHGKDGCKNSRCECHVEPEHAPKTSEDLFRELADARITLQLAEEELVARKKGVEEAQKLVEEAQKLVDDAQRQRSEAMASFKAAKKRFDDDMLAGIADEPKKEES
jgi:hypothetical protein